MSMMIPRTPEGTTKEVSLTSAAFSPKMARSSFSSGASSVSELSIVGKPVVFIPSPNVAEDHQLKNAKSIVENQAALLVEEKNIDELKKTISELNSSSYLRNKLSKNIKKSAFKNATKDIVDEIKILMN